MIILKDKKIEILDPKSLATLLQKWLHTLDDIERDKEHFVVILLDVRNKVRLIEVVTIGILNASVSHPREVYRRAIAEGAAMIIVAHNHPSGVCDPSDEDIGVTERLQEAGKIIGIALLDHLIFSDSTYLSFADQGLL